MIGLHHHAKKLGGAVRAFAGNERFNFAGSDRRARYAVAFLVSFEEQFTPPGVRAEKSDVAGIVEFQFSPVGAGNDLNKKCAGISGTYQRIRTPSEFPQRQAGDKTRGKV